MSGTSTVTSETTLLAQLRRQPSAYSSSVMWPVCKPSTDPSSSFTRHLPQEPLPEQGASMATLAARAVSSKVSPGAAVAVTGAAPFSKVKMT